MSPIHEPGTFPTTTSTTDRPASAGRYLLSRDGEPWCAVESLLQAVVLGMRLGYDAEDTVTGEILVAVDPMGPCLCVAGIMGLEREGFLDLRVGVPVRKILLPSLEAALAQRTQARVAAMFDGSVGEPADPCLDID
jgi:hypothetical protein